MPALELTILWSNALVVSISEEYYSDTMRFENFGTLGNPVTLSDDSVISDLK